MSFEVVSASESATWFQIHCTQLTLVENTGTLAGSLSSNEETNKCHVDGLLSAERINKRRTYVKIKCHQYIVCPRKKQAWEILCPLTKSVLNKDCKYANGLTYY